MKSQSAGYSYQKKKSPIFRHIMGRKKLKDLVTVRNLEEEAQGRIPTCKNDKTVWPSHNGEHQYCKLFVLPEKTAVVIVKKNQHLCTQDKSISTVTPDRCQRMWMLFVPMHIDWSHVRSVPICGSCCSFHTPTITFKPFTQ